MLKNRTRPPGKPPFPEAIELEVVELTCSEPPGEVTHWTGRALAKVVGVSHGTVQRIWAKHDLQPHRIKTMKPTPPQGAGYLGRPPFCTRQAAGNVPEEIQALQCWTLR